MPILAPPPKLPMLEETPDLGLEYIESQRSWAHRTAYDMARTEKFYESYDRDPHKYPKAKKYILADKLALKPNFSRLDKSLLDLLSTRKTERSVGPRPLDFEDISTLLLASYGRQSHLSGRKTELEDRRTTPSPGGLCSSEIYYVSWRTEGLKPGVYHFQPQSAELEVMPWKLRPDLEEKLFSFLANFRDHKKVSGGIFVTSVLERLRIKYGNRYLRFCLLEVGLICQNLDLISNALGIHLWHHGATDEATTREVLRLDAVEEPVMYSAAVLGKK